MATGQWSVVRRHVERLFQGQGVSGLSEGELLRRFVSTRDEVAFGALLAHHGPMVLGVARRVALRARSEAESRSPSIRRGSRMPTGR